MTLMKLLSTRFDPTTAVAASELAKPKSKPPQTIYDNVDSSASDAAPTEPRTEPPQLRAEPEKSDAAKEISRKGSSSSDTAVPPEKLKVGSKDGGD